MSVLSKPPKMKYSRLLECCQILKMKELWSNLIKCLQKMLKGGLQFFGAWKILLSLYLTLRSLLTG